MEEARIRTAITAAFADAQYVGVACSQGRLRVRVERGNRASSIVAPEGEPVASVVRALSRWLI